MPPKKRKKEEEQKPKKKQKKAKSADEFWNKDTNEWSEKVPFIREIQAHRKNVPKYNWFPVETFKSKEEWKTADNLAKLCAENAPKLQGADVGFAKINPAKKLTKKQLKEKDSPDENSNSTVRLRLKLSHKQKQKFNLWLRATRITYNLCLELRERKETPPKTTKIVKKKNKNEEGEEVETKEVSLSWDTHMRRYCVNEKGILFENNAKLKWLLKVPSDVRGDVTRDLNKAYKTNFDKIKKAKVEGKDTTKFKMKKRNVFLDDQQSFSVTARNYNRDDSKQYGWLKEFKCQKWHTRFAEQLGVDDGKDELIPQSTNFMLRFVRERTGEYYVCFPTALPTKQQLNNSEPNRIISLDPGVRTFVTGYDPSGTILEWGGKNCIKQTYNLKLKAKALRARVNKLKLTPKVEDEEKREVFVVRRFKRKRRSRGTKAARKTSRRKHLKRVREARHKRHSVTFRNKRKRYWIRKQALKVELKVKNMIEDCHNKLVSHLCNTYSTVLLPRFDTQNMAEKRDAETGLWKRKINPKTAENMLTWSHYTFRRKLLAKAREYEGRVKIVVCDEHYTSKTCGNCGEIHHKLGGNKTFTCPTCSWSADRDQQAARNILLRFLTLHVS